ncbi:glycosyltransferase family 4 protein [Geodermatophilus sp. CPCC 205761]|uniref:glycosyltransferase family 4 protein n=1 Tax=Geodermatophilus sp. CPCC 205761 TaxID=2936597 RepID=UPI003EF0516E
MGGPDRSGRAVHPAVDRVHVVVPDGIDDPARVSGGNRYDREVCDDLRNAGWTVVEIAAPGSWPRPDAAALDALARSLDALPAGDLVLVDGLIASAARTVLVPRSGRLRLVVLVHMVFGGDAVDERDELAVLAAARAVVTTSAWTREQLLDRYALSPARVHVAHPGAGTAPASPGTAGGGRLLCVGALAPHKGQDLLLAALARTAGLPWRCTLVGPLDRDPLFVASLQRQAGDAGIADRVRIPGPRTGAALLLEYRGADVLVVPSRTETYGMAITEALATGLPVIAAEVGGVPEAVGRTASGVPGLLVPPDDSDALAAALARWLTDAEVRCRLRRAALRRRETLPDWRTTGRRIRTVLSAVGAERERPPLRTEW